MIYLGESDNLEAIVLVSDKPKAVIEMSEERAISVRAQLDLLIRTRQQRRRPAASHGSVEDVYGANFGDGEVREAAYADAQSRPPAPIPKSKREPWTGPSIAEELKSAAQLAEEAAARDAMEIADRAAKEAQAKRRARTLASRGNALEVAVAAEEEGAE